MGAHENAGFAKMQPDPLTLEFLRVHRAPLPQASMQLPREAGEGSYTQMRLRGGIGLSIVDVTFSRAVTLAGVSTPGDRYNLWFCLGGSMRWESWGSGGEYVVEAGESCFMDANKAFGQSTFSEGGGIYGFGLTLSGEALCGLFAPEAGPNPGAGICRALRQDSRLRLGGTDVKYRRIIHEVVSCRLAGSVRQIYCESKITELLALYLDECFFRNPEITGDSGLDSRSMEKLREVRKILDADIANAPPLSFLARMVGLNEYKLKTGFKKMFGMPVHAYVIDKRLEKARYLLETRRLRVTEAAQMVGYSELGQFAGKFRRKFGVTPSELLRTA